jgi:hypothetical protein
MIDTQRKCTLPVACIISGWTSSYGLRVHRRHSDPAPGQPRAASYETASKRSIMGDSPRRADTSSTRYCWPGVVRGRGRYRPYDVRFHRCSADVRINHRDPCVGLRQPMHHRRSDSPGCCLMHRTSGAWKRCEVGATGFGELSNPGLAAIGRGREPDAAAGVVAGGGVSEHQRTGRADAVLLESCGRRKQTGTLRTGYCENNHEMIG